MTTDPTTEFAEIEIGGGRRIACDAAFETEIVWEQLRTSGLYAEAAAGLRAGDVIVDVGAHIGLAAILFTDLVPGIEILGFEPAPRSYACLELNRERHLPTTTISPLAIGTRPGPADLTYYPGHTTLATLFVDDADDVRNMESVMNHRDVPAEMRDEFWPTFRADPETVPVEVSTLEQQLTERGIDEIALLKVDVERAELDVLNSLGAHRWPRVRRVIVEVHDLDGRLNQVTELLEGHGYQVRVATEDDFAEGSIRMVVAARE
ncbi:FkbM family methyltransferase [Amycolatopsis circi]|uniref:FkbM family methyltransferase n=1 Tax=Amycolatopsis circi TaxID=871959 RepID=UPI000E230B9F|nr:FkbM family methyltransferase [Amycolatopsis circi]